MNIETLKLCFNLLFVNRNLVTLRVSRRVSNSLNIGDADRSGDRLNNLLQLAAHIWVRLGSHGRRGDLIDKATLLARDHDHAGKMRIALDRFVLEVDEEGRDKYKEKDKRDHDVIVQASPFVRPKNVSADCAPNRAHGRDGVFQRHRGCFRSLQVYVRIHRMANLTSTMEINPSPLGTKYSRS